MLRSLKSLIIMRPFGAIILFSLFLTFWFALTSPNPQREVSQLQQQNTQLRESHKKLEVKMKALYDDLKKTQEEKEKKLTSLLKQITSQKETIAGHRNQIHDLSKQNSNLQDELQYHTNKLSKSERELSELTSRLREKERDFHALADRNSDLASQLSDSRDKPCTKDRNDSWFSILICIAGFCVGFGFHYLCC
ncbi:uncharacterized protein LOC132829056 isoform X2 [Hemiscyllium ocellatum]|uniref:uncharacterized protein LOC132829056 isoform X2 n=1 Tax=Hemiscyllium ocellatum TaxID=170820 RepID=UPI0029665770|nr:uncharacterized protein LOC132829056 isoform X2 [Hemiscyllium ocellatum]